MPDTLGEGPPEPALHEKVAFLCRSQAYADSVQRVDAVETHMSWVFLAGDWAYKLKKPVRYQFLDFSSREAWRLDCEEEVRLNCRLAPDHWGGNWGYAVPAAHVRFAHGLIRAGADIVHGHSSHHVRPFETFDGKLILYGCGDFLDD